MRRLTVLLPFPSRGLAQNARICWQARAALTARAREDAKTSALCAVDDFRREHGHYWKVVRGPVLVSILWRAPDRGQEPDFLNVPGWLKPHFDGMQGIVYASDRSVKQIGWAYIGPKERRKRGLEPGVEIVIEPMEVE